MRGAIVDERISNEAFPRAAFKKTHNLSVETKRPHIDDGLKSGETRIRS
jgi:hypothetical protein